MAPTPEITTKDPRLGSSWRVSVDAIAIGAIIGEKQPDTHAAPPLCAQLGLGQGSCCEVASADTWRALCEISALAAEGLATPNRTSAATSISHRTVSRSPLRASSSFFSAPVKVSPQRVAPSASQSSGPGLRAIFPHYALTAAFSLIWIKYRSDGLLREATTSPAISRTSSVSAKHPSSRACCAPSTLTAHAGASLSRVIGSEAHAGPPRPATANL